MSASRGKCRARAEARGEDPRGRSCRGAVDCLVLQRVPNPDHPRNFRYAKVGLCKFHTQQWLDWLAGKAEPLQYVPHDPPPTLQLEDVPPPTDQSSEGTT